MNTKHAPIAVVLGSSGFIGSAVAEAFVADGYDVRLVGGRSDARWTDADSLRRTVEGADVVVNFAGKSVSCRYTDANRDAILESRVRTTRALREAIVSAENPPRVWLNASTATIYRHTMDRANTESDGEIGSGFSVDVATAWEREFFAGPLPHTRRAALRMAIVIGDGPAARMLLAIARLGLGGPQHDGWSPPHRRYRGIGAHPTGQDHAPWYRTRGRQRFSWVHVDDVVGAIRFIRDDDTLSGPINIASPRATDNRTLMRTLRRVVGAPVWIPTTRWMLELGMMALRTEPELILKSRWVAPQTLTDAGFAFAHTDLEAALTDVHHDVHHGRRTLRASATERSADVS